MGRVCTAGGINYWQFQDVPRSLRTAAHVQFAIQLLDKCLNQFLANPGLHMCILVDAGAVIPKIDLNTIRPDFEAAAEQPFVAILESVFQTVCRQFNHNQFQGYGCPRLKRNWLHLKDQATIAPFVSFERIDGIVEKFDPQRKIRLYRNQPNPFRGKVAGKNFFHPN